MIPKFDHNYMRNWSPYKRPKSNNMRVVVCHWAGDPVKYLYRLLNQMRKVESGSLFDVVIVCNGDIDRPLVIPSHFNDLSPRIINRENEGYNLGAWDCGWKNAKDYEFYLFLQDQCFLKKSQLAFRIRVPHVP